MKSPRISASTPSRRAAVAVDTSYSPGSTSRSYRHSGFEPDAAQRCLDRIQDWERKIQWGRIPRDHLTYLTGSGEHNFYRERVGNSAYRVVYEISGDTMTTVAVFPKDDHAYDLTDYNQRMEDS